MKLKKSSPALAAHFDKSLPDDPRAQRRQMFGYPAAFANGNMFAGLFEETCVVKLPEAERETLRSRHGGTPFEPMPGRPMKAFTVLPEAILRDGKAFTAWLTRGLAYAAALPPKAKKAARKAAKRTK